MVHHRFNIDPVSAVSAEHLACLLPEPAALLARRQLADLGDVERQIKGGQPRRGVIDVVGDDAPGQEQDVRRLGRWADGSVEEPRVCASNHYKGARPARADYALADPRIHTG